MKDHEKSLVAHTSVRLAAVMAELANAHDGEFTVDQFADLAGANRNAASNWLNGYNLPPVWRMIALCEQTGITLDWIYRGDSSGLALDLAIRLNARVAGVPVKPGAAEPPAAAASPVAAEPVRSSPRAKRRIVMS